VSQAIFII